MNIKELITNSGDSHLESYSFSEGLAVVKLKIDELDQYVILKIKTNLMAFNVNQNTSPAYRTCFCELINLNDVLDLNNGIYIASSNFGKFMQEKKGNLNLAYGLKSKEFKFIFSLSSREKLASFIISSKESIHIEIIEQ